MKRQQPAWIALLFAVVTLFSGLALAAPVLYQYDDLHRLTKVVYPNGPTIDYSYDPAGNRTRKVVTGGQLPPVALFNISTRARVRAGDGILIGGFVVRGETPKRLLLRARGPSLANARVVGTMNDPTLRLFAGGTQIGFNDNWGEGGQAADILATGRAPAFASEAAALVTLAPGSYTVHVADAQGLSGVAIVEVIGIDEEAGIRLFNLSTRGKVEDGDDVMIGGLVIRGDGAKRLLIRARGPSLANAGVAGALGDPTLELFSEGRPITFNDDWRQGGQENEIIATGRAPISNLESAILVDLMPGAYTAIVRGKSGSTGIGIVEVIAIDEASFTGTAGLPATESDEDLLRKALIGP